MIHYSLAQTLPGSDQKMQTGELAKHTVHFEHKNTFTLKVECVGENIKYFLCSQVFFQK